LKTDKSDFKWEIVNVSAYAVKPLFSFVAQFFLIPAFDWFDIFKGKAKNSNEGQPIAEENTETIDAQLLYVCL